MLSSAPLRYGSGCRRVSMSLGRPAAACSSSKAGPTASSIAFLSMLKRCRAVAPNVMTKTVGIARSGTECEWEELGGKFMPPWRGSTLHQTSQPRLRSREPIFCS